MQQIILFLLVLIFPITGSALTLSTTLSMSDHTVTGPYRFALPLTAQSAANVNSNPGNVFHLPPIYKTGTTDTTITGTADTDSPQEGIPLAMSGTLEPRPTASLAVRQNLRFIQKHYGRDIEDAVKPLAHVTAAIMSMLVNIESHGDRYAVSPKGAQGIMQIDHVTQRELGMKQGDAFIPKKALPKGAGYLETLYNRFGNWPSTFLAYNMGPRNAQKYLRNGKDPTEHPYVRRALDLLASL